MWSSQPEWLAPGDSSRCTPFQRKAKGEQRKTRLGSTQA
jgi:hypothetical protein